MAEAQPGNGGPNRRMYVVYREGKSTAASDEMAGPGGDGKDAAQDLNFSSTLRILSLIVWARSTRVPSFNVVEIRGAPSSWTTS